MTNKEIAKNKAVATKNIVEKIQNLPTTDLKIVYTTVDGEYLDELYISKESNKEISREYRLIKKVVKPYSILSKAKFSKDLLQDFSKTDKGHILDLMVNIDALGRIKYGENYQQYCRNFEDLAKSLNISYDTFRKSLLPKLIKNDLIRTLEIQKSYGKIKYVSFNPAIISGGGYYDRWTVLVWSDVILEHSLLTDKEIKSITGLSDKEIEEIKNKKDCK